MRAPSPRRATAAAAVPGAAAGACRAGLACWRRGAVGCVRESGRAQAPVRQALLSRYSYMLTRTTWVTEQNASGRAPARR